MDDMIYDVLIIGSGGAGLSAAIEAKKNAQKVVVISKTSPTSSQTSQAQGGINAVLGNKNDSIEEHINDTVKSAHLLGDDKAIRFMCENAENTITWLDTLGVPFSRDENNSIAQRNFGGASKPRTCYSSDYTGLKMLHTLYDTCIKEKISFLNEYLVLSFIKDEGENCIKGIIVLDITTGTIQNIFAKTVIVASGGYAGLYNNFTTNSTATTGEMLTLALNIGCELENMEFIQFHPTSLRENKILISESARGEGGYLVDQDGKRFIDELKPRDEVSRAIYEKIIQGDKVYLDLRHLGFEKIQENMPQEYTIVYEFTGRKFDKDLIEITPSAHYTMGGIKVDIAAQTNIKNLYACGECASNRVHGANRLGGNSLLEIIVFGRIAGKNASLSTQSITSFDTSKYQQNLTTQKSKIQSIYTLPNTINFQQIKLKMGEELFLNVGLFRDENKLENMLEQLKLWQEQLSKMGIEDKSKVYNTDLKEFLEFQNMLALAFIIVLSALERKESRGAHYRSDYASQSKNFQCCTVVKNTNTLRVIL